MITKNDCKKARERYQGFSQKEKEKNQQYSHKRYKNLPEYEKQKLVQYRKRYYKIRKSVLL